MNTQSIGEHFLADALRSFRDYKKLAERAFAQLDDADFFRTIDEESNSIAVNMKHMAGNMFSRWTDFLTSDGEKPERNRDREFIDDLTSRQEITQEWERGWDVLFEALRSLRPGDLGRTVVIRSEPHSVPDALHRALAHVAYHVGQIVQLARYLAKDRWDTITIARGGSDEFNRRMMRQRGAS